MEFIGGTYMLDELRQPECQFGHFENHLGKISLIL